MKNPKYKLFFMGVCFTGVGIVFLSVENKRLGALILGLGVLMMLIGISKILKKPKT